MSEQAALSCSINVRAASTEGPSMSVPCSCSPLIVVAPSDRNFEIASATKAASPHDGSKTVSVGRRIAQSTRKVAIGCGVKNAPRAFLAGAAESKVKATVFTINGRSTLPENAGASYSDSSLPAINRSPILFQCTICSAVSIVSAGSPLASRPSSAVALTQ